MLTTGDLLVALALICTAVSFVSHLIAIRTGRISALIIGMGMNLMALVLSIMVWALITNYFVNGHIEYEYVHEHTSVDLPLAYKISGVWAGKVGSFLLWVLSMQVGLVLAQARHWSRLDMTGKGRRARATTKEGLSLMSVTGTIGSFMVLLFLAIFSRLEPFKATEPIDMLHHPDGMGLNVLLQHPLMAIHPFLALIGYGIATVPFVASVSFMLSGNRQWAGYALPFSRAFFLLFTVALTLGGLWAYTTLGWGGYWAWDPVETSSLLPWLMAVVVCHTQVSFVKHRRSKLLGAMTSYFLLPVILFATFAARSGLWSSVHAYASTEGDFWTVVSASGFLTGLLALMVILVIIGPILLIKAYVSYFEHNEAPDPGGQVEGRTRGPDNPLSSRGNAVLFANVLILMGLLVIIFIMLLRIGGGLNAEEFEVKLAPLALILVSGMMMYHYGTRRTGHLPFMALAIGIGAGLVGLGLHPGQPIASFSIPLLGVAAAGVVLHVLRSPRSRRKKSRLHDSGAPLIHIGVILMLIGYAGSTFLAHERTVTLSEGAPVGFEGYDLVLESKDEGDDHIFLNIVVKKDDGTLGRARPGLKVIDGQTRAEVSVVKVPGKDLRFVLGGWDDVLETELGTRAKVEVRSLPAMNLLWGGAFMIVAGTALRFFPSGPHYDSEPRGPVPLRRPFDAEE